MGTPEYDASADEHVLRMENARLALQVRTLKHVIREALFHFAADQAETAVAVLSAAVAREAE